MKRLVFDCSSDIASIAVFQDSELLSELSVTGKKNHAAILLPSIDQCLTEAGMAFSDVDEVYVCSGPGSFTGVKVGLATAMGLVQFTNKKLYVFPYAALILAKALRYYPRLLDGVSKDFLEHSEDGRIVLCMDAGRGESYCTYLSVAGDEVLLLGSELIKGEYSSKAFLFSESEVSGLFLMPERYRSLFLSEEIKPLYFRKSQAEESLEKGN